MPTKSFFLLILLLISPFLTFSCSSDDEQEEVLSLPKITIIFSPGGLGDNGYNDLILRGAQQLYNTRYDDVDLKYCSPESYETATEHFYSWLKQVNNDDNPELYVLASSDYVTLVEDGLKDYGPLPDNKKILLFECDDLNLPSVTTFRLSMYGVAYLTAKAAREAPCHTPLIILANPTDVSLKVAAAGFTDGFAIEPSTEGYNEADSVATVYLSDDWHGYAMADELYLRMFDYRQQRYDYYFCVAGGSNTGLYRYFRTYPNGWNWTTGVDVDQSSLSADILSSMVKHIDRLLVEYLNSWIDDQELPSYKVYGLRSGYTEWVVNPLYENNLDGFLSTFEEEAIRKEEDYEEDL